MVQTHSNPARPQSDSRSFECELVKTIPYLNRLAYKVCHDRDKASDLAQETLLKAWRARSRFQPGSNFKAWLFTILRNEDRSGRRRSWRQMPWDQKLAENLLITDNEQLSTLELKDTLRLMTKLPKAQRNALIMIGANGMSYHSAAEVTHCPAGTLKSRVSRARAALKLEFEPGAAPSHDMPTLPLAVIASAQRRAAGLGAVAAH